VLNFKSHPETTKARPRIGLFCFSNPLYHGIIRDILTPMADLKIFAMRLLGFAVLSTMAVNAQLVPSPDVTNGFTNGRLWQKLDAGEKVFFLVGCQDALLLGSMTVTGDYTKIPEQLKWPELTPTEVSKELDLLYSEGANGPIPMIFALRYVRHKAAGDTPDQLQQLLASLRRIGAPK
jgi:hypothetical protein